MSPPNIFLFINGISLPLVISQSTFTFPHSRLLLPQGSRTSMPDVVKIVHPTWIKHLQPRENLRFAVWRNNSSSASVYDTEAL